MSHLNTPPVRNRAPLTARSSSLMRVSAAEHQTAEQYSKTGRTKPPKHLPISDLSWNTRQDFLKIPSLCEAALETERRCFSKAIFESNVTPKIICFGYCGFHFRIKFQSKMIIMIIIIIIIIIMINKIIMNLDSYYRHIYNNRTCWQ